MSKRHSASKHMSELLKISLKRETYFLEIGIGLENKKTFIQGEEEGSQ